MPAGTIALTNNSTAVTGTGTGFKSNLAVNDFIVAVVGGVTYTLGVKSIESDTALTLITAYDGPATSGAAWSAVANQALVGITAQVAADVAKAIRGLNLDKANWQQVFSGTGTITVKLPDGSTYNGPAWNSITNAITAKADLTNGAVAVSQGGTGAKTPADARAGLGLKGAAVLDVGTASGTVAAGNDSRITGALQKSGDTMTGQLTSSYKSGASFICNASGAMNSGNNTFNNFGAAFINSSQYMQMDVWNDSANVYARIVTWNTNAKVFRFVDNGNGICDGQWISGSDERHKSNIKLVPDALRAVMSWRGCTYDKKDGLSEVGLIAQDVEKNCPLAVINTGQRKYSDGSVIEDFKSLNVAGAAAAYHTEAIKALFSLVELAIVDPDKALASIDAIKAELLTEEK